MDYPHHIRYSMRAAWKIRHDHGAWNFVCEQMPKRESKRFLRFQNKRVDTCYPAPNGFSAPVIRPLHDEGEKSSAQDRNRGQYLARVGSFPHLVWNPFEVRAGLPSCRNNSAANSRAPRVSFPRARVLGFV